MLLCGIIDDLENEPGVNANLGYFFCQVTDFRINRAAAVIGGLIFSLARRNERNKALISRIWTEKVELQSQLGGPNEWHVLCDVFEAITQDSTLTDPVCVVDALNECEYDCQPLLNLIVKTSSRVKWLISSRNVKDVEQKFRLVESPRRLRLDLTENAEYVSENVDAYIDNAVKDIEALQGDKELQVRASEALKRKADGTFLWVARVIDELRDTHRLNVEDVLGEMPKGLENLYDLIMKRSNERLRQKGRGTCQALLAIVTVAERPLQLEELFVFLSSQRKYCAPSKYDLRDMADTVKDCGSFLSIRDNTVYFVHQSVKEYMVGKALNSIFPSGIGYQHYEMVTSSLDVMSHILQYDIYNLKVPETVIYRLPLSGPDPLAPIAYCCVFWIEHLVRVYQFQMPESEELLKDNGRVNSFLKDKYLCWLEALAHLYKLKPEGTSAVRKLKNLAASYRKRGYDGHRQGDLNNLQGERDAGSLGNFIEDAFQFLDHWKAYVQYQPLLLYYSAIVFEDKHSLIYQAFQEPVQARFGPFPTFISPLRKEFSLLHAVGSDNHSKAYSMLYSPDSSLLCLLDFDGQISLWRTDTGALAHTIEQEFSWELQITSTDPLLRLFMAFTPDSKHLVSVSNTGLVQVWAIDGGAQTQKYSLNLDVRVCISRYSTRSYTGWEPIREEVISLSPNGDVVAATYRTPLEGKLSVVKVWMLQTRRLLCVIDQPFTSKRLHAAFSPNSALLALIDGFDVRIYSTLTGEEVHNLQYLAMLRVPDHESPLHSSEINSQCKFSPDSKLFAYMCDNKNIFLWSTETWSVIRHIGTNNFPLSSGINDFDLSPDSTDIAVCFSEGMFVGKISTEDFLFDKTAGAERVLFSPNWRNSSLLASTSRNAVKIWRANTSYMFNRVKDPSVNPSDMTISSNSKFVAALDLERENVTIWSGESGNCEQVMKRGESAEISLVFSPDSQLLACFEHEGDIRIWRVSTGKLIHLLKSVSSKRWNTKHLAFSYDSRYIFASSEHDWASVWSVESGKCVFSRENVRSAVISPVSEHIALSSTHGKLQIWDWRTDRRVSSFQLERDVCEWQDIVKLAFSSDSSLLAVAHGRHWAQIWEWRSGRCVSRFQLESERDTLICGISEELTFSSDNTVLAVIYWNRVQMWEVATGTLLACVAVEENIFGLPSFDPVEGCIFTSRSVYGRSGSSWKYWGKIPWPGYSLSPNSPTDGCSWICLDGERIHSVPSDFSPRGKQWYISGSLLAYSSQANRMTIFKLPTQHDSNGRKITALDSHASGDSDLAVGVSGADSNVEVYSTREDVSTPNRPKKRKLECL